MSGARNDQEDARLAARATLSIEILQEAADLLRTLDWASPGLTRDMIRKRAPQFPVAVYLHLPSSKHFYSPRQVLYEAESASGRAEGEYLSADFDFPDQESVADGGPPGWGPNALLSHHGVVDSGSAEDREPEGGEES